MKLGEVDGKKIGCTVSLLVSSFNCKYVNVYLLLLFHSEVITFLCQNDEKSKTYVIYRL